MNVTPAQLELFPVAKPNVFKGLKYWRLSDRRNRAASCDKIAQIVLHDGIVVRVSRQSTGPGGNPRLYTFVPDYGTVQCRNFKSLLAEVSLIDRGRAINKSARRDVQSIQGQLHSVQDQLHSVVGQLREQDELLQSALNRTCELEKENAQLSEELAAVRAPKAEGPTQLRNDVRLVRPKLAAELGVPTAMVLEQLGFLLRIGVGRIFEGKRFITNTSKEWVEKYFPFYSEWTVERAFAVLEDKKLVEGEQLDGRDSRVKSYRITSEGSKMLPSGQNKGAKTSFARKQYAATKGAKCSLPSSEESNTSTTTAATQKSSSSSSRDRIDKLPSEKDDTAWLVELGRKHGFDPQAEWRRCKRKCKELWDREPSRTFFEKSWIPNIEYAAHPKIKNVTSPAEIEPCDWPDWWKCQRFKDDPPCPPFSEAPAYLKAEYMAHRASVRHC